MKVSVVIPVKNEEEIIERCLRSLLLQTHLPNEIIVIDNDSTDTTVERVADLQSEFAGTDVQLVLLSCVNGNQIEARQMGFGTAKHPLIVSIDADSVLDTAWIQHAVELFNNRNEVVGAGGPLIYDTLLYSVAHYIVYLGLSVFKSRFYFYGSNACFRRDAFHAIKGLEGCRSLMEKEKLGEPHDDLYLSYQLKAVGTIQPCFSLRARVQSRTGTARETVLSLLQRLLRQARESVRLQRLLLQELERSTDTKQKANDD